MSRRIPHALAVVCLAAGLAASAAEPATAAPGAGTFTRITTPKGTTSFRFTVGGANEFTVSGTASADVTAVDIDCIDQPAGTARHAVVFASGVPVSPGGHFTTTAAYPSPFASDTQPGCRLRAVPTGVDPTNPNTYLGSYSGPVLHSDALAVDSVDGHAYGFTVRAGTGDGSVIMNDAELCGVSQLATLPASTFTPAGSMFACMVHLTDHDFAHHTSSITVNGHPAYTPRAVHDYLNGPLGFTLTQSDLDVHMKIAKSGDVTVTESAPLMRCSMADTYPPTPESCPQLVSTGVTFERASTFFRGGHQVQIRDTFVSTDAHKHTVHLAYETTYPAPETGELGFTFPGHGSGFTTIDPGATITGLGSKAGTLFVRSDRRAADDDPAADTRALTWSQPPTKVQVDSFQNGDLQLPYTLTVPASGEAFLGFADSEGTLTSDVKKLAAAAVHDVVGAPTITSPHNGATVHGSSVTVEGKVDAGANGLPTKVTVNGHRAHLGATSVVHGEWHLTLKELPGTHTVVVVAYDRVGNTASSSIKIHQKK